jgi:penicillin-binding protein 1C
MISHGPNRALTFGQDSILNVPQGFAVKTGTSKDMRDNWCVGFNSDYTIGVWVGNADASPMQNVLGVTGAAPVWRSVVDYLLAKKQNNSEWLSSETVDAFLLGEKSAALPKEFNKNEIISPGKQAIYALDPNIPFKFQKVLLESKGPQKNIYWKFKGKVLSDNKWTPEKGWQKIELFKNNQKVDETVFLVK